jgi:arabinogalactan oligomer / maltooligosaccharide transport system permease protein
MSIVQHIRQSAMFGLGASLLTVLLLSLWLQGDADDALRAQQQQRHVVLVANAIAASVAASPEDELGQRLRAWKTANLSIESVRVIAGRELIASTRAEDGAPRGLQRDEKPLFDLANELRAAAETTRSEGVVRKKTIQIDAGQVTTVTVPYEPQGQFAGIVQLRLLPPGSAAAHGTGGWGPALLMLLAALATGALVRIELGKRFDMQRAGAVLALLVLSLGYQQQRLTQLSEATARVNTEIGAVQRDTAAIYDRTGAPRLEARSPSAWDTDAYRRPLQLITQGGQVIEGAVVAAAERERKFLQRSLWLTSALGVGVLLFFLQGYAAATFKALREHADAYAYVAPAMIGMLVLVFFPFFYGIGLAFTDTTLFNESLPWRERFIGLDNFISILGDFNVARSGADGLVWNYQNFYWTLMVTVIWTFTNVSIGVSVGFLLALALNTEGLRGKAIYRVLLILPWAIPNYITALVWRGMFHPQFGVINQFLQMAGFAPVAWFDGVVSAFLTGLATNGWLSFPFMMVVILGALQSIPKEMYEAAELEGASRWQRLRSITLPLLRPTLVPAVVLSVVWTFNMFNIIFLVSGGEPAGANEILVTKAYKIAFENYQYAYAAAYSTVIFLILLVYGYFQTRLTRATESY